MITFLIQGALTNFGVVPISIAILVAFVAFKTWRTLSHGAKHVSLFGPEFKTSKKPIEDDKKKREAVLSQRFKPDRVKGKEYDTILIGSGPGSLSCALLLSRLGHRVLVLEQHDVTGGTLHTFRDKGFEFSTGLHYLGGLGIGDFIRFYFDQLTRYQVDFNVLDDSFDQLAIVGKESIRWYKPPSGYARVVSYLVTLFPKEREAIETFYKTMVECGKGLTMYLGLTKFLPIPLLKFLFRFGLFRFLVPVYGKGYHETSLSDYIKELTNDEELYLLLSYIIGDYGSLPSRSPVLIYGAVLDHFKDGAYYPIGGASEIVYHMCTEIRERGGEVLVCAEVNSILCNSEGRAIGVEIGNSKTQVHATNIVSGAGMANTLHKLLPQDVALKSPAYSVYENIGPSVGFLTLFVGLDGTPSDLDLPAGNIWVYRDGYDYNRMMEDYFDKKFDELPEDVTPPGFYISFGSSKDPHSKITMPGKTSLEIIMYCNPEWFQEWDDERKGHRGQTYEDRKNDFGKSLWNVVLSLFPHLDGKVIYFEVGSTSTAKYYMGTESGEMYGMKHHVERFTPTAQVNMRPDIGIDGLFITGSDITTCGICPSTISGLITASKISKRNLFSELESEYKKTLK